VGNYGQMRDGELGGRRTRMLEALRSLARIPLYPPGLLVRKKRGWNFFFLRRNTMLKIQDTYGSDLESFSPSFL
jgi:hypothetical protein